MLIKRIVSFAAVAAFTIAMCSPAVAQEPEKLNVLGTPMVLKIDGQKTGGAMAVVEETYPPGHGAPQHVHAKEDELFYIIEGQFRLWRGDEALDVSPGDVAFLPRSVPHTYQNVGSEPGRLLTTITPAGFEGFFRAVSRQNLTPKDMEQLQALAKEYGLEILGPHPDAAGEQ